MTAHACVEAERKRDLRFGSLGDIAVRRYDVGFTPDNGRQTVVAECPLSAIRIIFHSGN